MNNASSDYRNSPQNLKREREPQNGKNNRFIARKRNFNSQRNTWNNKSGSRSRKSCENSRSRNLNNSHDNFEKPLNNIPNKNDKQHRSMFAEFSEQKQNKNVRSKYGKTIQPRRLEKRFKTLEIPNCYE